MSPLHRQLGPVEPLGWSVKAAVLCALVSVFAVGIALISARYAPFWAQTALLTVLVANAIPVFLFRRQLWRWDGITGIVVAAVGIYNITMVGLLRTFSEFGTDVQGGWVVSHLLGLPRFSVVSIITSPEVLLPFVVLLTGVLLGTIGIWFTDDNAVRRFTGHPWRWIGIGVSAIILLTAFHIFLDGLSLIVLIWATGNGILLIPVVAVGAIRWGQTASRVTGMMIGVLASGLIVLLATWLWIASFSTTLLGCPDPFTFSQSLNPMVNLATLEFRGMGGCNSQQLSLMRLPVQIGAIITAVGSLGTVVCSLRDW